MQAPRFLALIYSGIQLSEINRGFFVLSSYSRVIFHERNLRRLYPSEHKYWSMFQQRRERFPGNVLVLDKQKMYFLIHTSYYNTFTKQRV